MILDRNCTRNCTFCNVSRNEPDEVNPGEPENVAEAVRRLKLRHAVITSVTRDDLDDQGAGQFVRVVEEIRKISKRVTVELLIPDMQGKKDLLDQIIASVPDVLNHNVETVPALYPEVRPIADFERSLSVLQYIKEKDPRMLTKSGMMLGLGETEDQVMEVFRRLVESKCDILTLGQYLQPSSRHIAVKEYVRPEIFEHYRNRALEMGFRSVASAPLVRSSYHAEDLNFLK